MNFASNSLYVNSFLDITSKTIVTSLSSAPIPVNKMMFPYILDKLPSAKNNPIASMFDGMGMGLGFTLALTLLGAVRELMGTGKIFDMPIYGEEYGMLLFVLPPGAFIALGYLIAVINRMKKA